MGGRIASQAAARDLFDPPAADLLFRLPAPPTGQTRPAARSASAGDQHPDAVPARHARSVWFAGRDAGPDCGPPTSRLELIDGGDHSLVATKKARSQGRLIDRAMDLAAEFILQGSFNTKARRARRRRRTRRNNSKTFSLHLPSRTSSLAQNLSSQRPAASKPVGPFVAAVEPGEVVRHTRGPQERDVCFDALRGVPLFARADTNQHVWPRRARPARS